MRMKMTSKRLRPMTGGPWEQLPYPMIVDTGACVSVMPCNWCTHAPLKSTAQSDVNAYFKAANGDNIYNEGQRMVTRMGNEGARRDMTSTACGSVTALWSVSQMCRVGHRVAFNPPWDPAGSYVEHLSTGECMWLEEKAGLYLFNAKVAPTRRQTESIMVVGGRWMQDKCGNESQGFA